MQSPADRAVGSYPLSISTSLAIEGGLGVHPDHPAGKYLLTDFEELWVNVKTLFRNYYNAQGRENFAATDLQEEVDHFNTEINNLISVVKMETEGKVNVVLYLPDYNKVKTKFPHALLRTDTTDIQRAYTDSMVAVINQVLLDRKEQIKIYADLIKENSSKKALLLTHFPIDLTTTSFPRLALLESHTGNIKTKESWHTKLYNGKELSAIPLTQGTLTIFGDSEMFRPLPIQYRKALIDLSKQYRWSFATTKDKILYGLNTLKDRYMAEQLKMWLFTHL